MLYLWTSTLQQKWVDAIRTEWFACVSQKSLTPACAQSYISTISRLSHKLLDVVINLQDQKVNVSLNVTMLVSSPSIRETQPFIMLLLMEIFLFLINL